MLKIKDLSDATVVMLYMGDDLNLQLRPILQKTLKPGSRIVSHRFTMGDWKPDKTINVTTATGRSTRSTCGRSTRSERRLGSPLQGMQRAANRKRPSLIPRRGFP